MQQRCVKMYIHIWNAIFAFGYTFCLQMVKELRHLGTIAAPAEKELGCKLKTSLAILFLDIQT